MKKLRNLMLPSLFVLSALCLQPVAIQAEPEAPGADCYWIYGANSTGIWSCSWGCDYIYAYENGEWVEIGRLGSNCGDGDPLVN